MAVLLLAEMNGAELALDATAKSVTAALALGDVTVLCASFECGGAAEAAAGIAGVSKVLCADNAAYGNGLAEPVADLIVSLADGYEHIVAPATNSAKNILPRVAALLDAMVITDITAVVDGNTFERPISLAMQSRRFNLLTPRKSFLSAHQILTLPALEEWHQWKQFPRLEILAFLNGLKIKLQRATDPN